MAAKEDMEVGVWPKRGQSNQKVASVKMQSCIVHREGQGQHCRGRNSVKSDGERSNGLELMPLESR